MALYITKSKEDGIKTRFRKICKAHLQTLSKKSNFSDKKTAFLLKNKLLTSKNILLYLPMQTEVNIKPLIEWLKKRRGTRVFIPYIEGISFKVIPYRLPLRKNQYGIFEARKSLFYFNNIDTVIVPVLGIDTHFKRIGFGKGMYDRFFASLPYRPKIIFIARVAWVSKLSITEHYDICADSFIANDCVLKRGLNDRIHCSRVYNIRTFRRY